MGILYTFGLGLFRSQLLAIFKEIILQHYQIALMYTSIHYFIYSYLTISAFLGIAFVHFKVFSYNNKSNKSLFDVVRWGLLLTAFSTIFNATASACGSVVCFLVFFTAYFMVSKILSML